ncbi:MAG: hypothetical protein M3Q23_00485 [Actinomycetota bacterium]|nr:hypothetical protein [Actinomycetota bacterium]
MDLAARIQQLEDMIKEAKSMPLSSSALLNREELLEVVAEMRDSLPEEIKQARWVVKDREELLVKARREADALLEKARAEQARLLSREAVVQASQEEAEHILGEAREQARQVKLEAEDYVDAKLAQFEITLQRLHEGLAQTHEAMAESFEHTRGSLDKTVEQVQRGREKLQGLAHPAQELVEEQGEQEELQELPQ